MLIVIESVYDMEWLGKGKGKGINAEHKKAGRASFLIGTLKQLNEERKSRGIDPSKPLAKHVVQCLIGMGSNVTHGSPVIGEVEKPFHRHRQPSSAFFVNHARRFVQPTKPNRRKMLEGFRQCNHDWCRWTEDGGNEVGFDIDSNLLISTPILCNRLQSYVGR